nr:MAG TPA: hypothetical protein [Caudoviricetes sp.]
MNCKKASCSRRHNKTKYRALPCIFLKYFKKTVDNIQRGVYNIVKR